MRLGLVVEGEDGRLGLALDDLSTTTRPLQYRYFELDRQETGATECVRVLVQFLQADPDLAIPSVPLVSLCSTCQREKSRP